MAVDNGKIEFRPLDIEDLAQMFSWLLKPHVAKWYAPAPKSFMEMAAKFGPRTQPGNPVQAFVIVLGGVDIGYIQTYWIAEFPDYATLLGCEAQVGGIDFFIGEERFVLRGIGSRVLRAFVDDVVFARNGASACVCGPSEGNAVSIAALKKAGFTEWKRVKPESGDPECVLRRERAGG